MSIIVAVAKNNIIGIKGKLPWDLPEDLKHFKKLTTGHHILMGLATFNSVGKPLPGRANIVLSDKKGQRIKGCIVVNSLEDGINYAKENGEKELFIIGGASVYKQTINLADKLYLTKIRHEFKGDTFFPKVEKNKWKEVSKKDHKKSKSEPFNYSFLVFEST